MCIHRPVGREGAGVVRGRGEIVDIAVRDFEDSLVDDVLVGAADSYYASFSMGWHGGDLLYAELDMLDARRNAVHDLLLRRGARYLHGGGAVVGVETTRVVICYRSVAQ